ncbi:hypothetical protein ACTJJB_01535 [Chitinophaga sp. 22536]|uniref:hypothetical protein n=1 Tax=unclassified Chitinophaga TaxID=2619133 RepID=UPI003F83CE79
MSDSKIERAVRQLAGMDASDKVSMMLCNVESVDIDNRTCTCSNITGTAVADILDAQLMAEVDDGVLHVPAVNSTVVVVLSKYVPPYVAMFSELDRIYTVVGNSVIDVSPDKITLNNGSFGGLVKVIDLTNKLNALENKVNDLVTTFNSHVHTGVTTGTGATAITATPVTGTITPTQRNEIENTTVIHGS